jgi:hypothetical protein
MVNWNPAILDTQIAPGISTFCDATIPDITGMFPEAEHWATNYFLNSVFRGGYAHGVRQVVVGFLRRATLSYTAFHEATQSTRAFLDGADPTNPRIAKYYQTIGKWETFAINMTIAADLFKWINNGDGAFSKNDGSKECRLYELGNKVKHLSGSVDLGHCTINDSLPLWIDSAGLHSFGFNVTYQEASEVLVDICNLANELQDPLGRLERMNSSPDNKTTT